MIKPTYFWQDKDYNRFKWHIDSSGSFIKWSEKAQVMDVQLLSNLDLTVDKFTKSRTIESCSNFILERK